MIVPVVLCCIFAFSVAEACPAGESPMISALKPEMVKLRDEHVTYLKNYTSNLQERLYEASYANRLNILNILCIKSIVVNATGLDISHCVLYMKDDLEYVLEGLDGSMGSNCRADLLNTTTNELLKVEDNKKKVDDLITQTKNLEAYYNGDHSIDSVICLEKLQTDLDQAKEVMDSLFKLADDTANTGIKDFLDCYIEVPRHLEATKLGGTKLILECIEDVRSNGAKRKDEYVYFTRKPGLLPDATVSVTESSANFPETLESSISMAIQRATRLDQAWFL